MTSQEPRTSLKNAYSSAKSLLPNAEEVGAEDYCTPGAFELERLFWKGSPQYTHVNEVWPKLFIGDEATALDRYGLQKAGFTHVLNAAHGRRNVDTGPDYYRGMDIEYHGVEADDVPTFDLSVFFYSAAAFIDGALHADHSNVLMKKEVIGAEVLVFGDASFQSRSFMSLFTGHLQCCAHSGFPSRIKKQLDSDSSPRDKILVHCVMGRSRSATLVLAYLMIHRNMTLVDAIQQVAKNRCVLPNWGFLKQLRELDKELVQQRRQAQHSDDSEKASEKEL